MPNMARKLTPVNRQSSDRLQNLTPLGAKVDGQERPSFKALADAGYLQALLPIVPPDVDFKGDPEVRGKVPGKPGSGKTWYAIKHWAKSRPTDEAIARWDAFRTKASIGVQTREHPAVDIDVDDPVLADKIEKLATEMFGPAPTRTRGGARRLMLYGLDGAPFRKRRVKFEDATGQTHVVELLADGQQFVAYGKHKSGQYYTWRNGDPVTAGADGLTQINTDQVKAFFDELDFMLEVAGCTHVKGSGGGEMGERLPIGDQSLMGDAQTVLEALKAIPCDDLDYDQWIAVLAATKAALGGDEEHYDAVEEWCLQYEDNTPEQIKAKWDSIADSEVGANYLFRHAHEHGFNTAALDFEVLDDEPTPADDPAMAANPAVDPNCPGWCAELNKQFFVGNEGGRLAVFYETFNSALKRNVLEHHSFRDFENRFCNRMVTIGFNAKGDEVKERMGKAWLNSEYRREYAALEFLPGQTLSPDRYNKWRGFGVEPKRGNWGLMRSHIEEVICAGDQAHAAYLLRWLARMFQHPDQPGEVAVVLRGPKGAGKTIFGEALAKLLSPHSIVTTRADDLFGRFNAELGESIFVFVDEARGFTNRATAGQLNGLITGATFSTERKFGAKLPAKNCLHLVLASNDGAIIPASADERRYFALDVSAARVKDRAYFLALSKQMESGGLEAMLHDLLNMDLAGFEVRDVPETAALRDQKDFAMSGVERLFADWLEAGQIDLGFSPMEWPEDASLEVAKADLIEAMRGADRPDAKQEARNALSVQMAGRKLHVFFPSVADRDRGHRKDNSPRRVYVLPPLAQARSEFEERGRR